jgi:iron uptake system EfeUOB component EfeO/EfeM
MRPLFFTPLAKTRPNQTKSPKAAHPDEMDFSRLEMTATSKQIHNFQIKSRNEQRDWHFTKNKIKQEQPHFAPQLKENDP